MKLNVFRTTIKEGNFTKKKELYPNLTKKEIDLLYDTNIKRFLKTTGLQLESYIVLTKENKEIKSRNITRTTKKVKEGIIILKSTIQNTAVLVETSDDPVIIASANDIAVIALGTIENINNGIIHEMIESLIKETNAAPFEMTFYITACPSKENYKLSSISNLTNKYIWQDSYSKEGDNYYLDIRYSIYNQLIHEIVDPNYIYFDSKDTTKTENYYSDIAKREGNNLVCVVYTNEEDA